MPRIAENNPTVATVLTSSLPRRYLSVISRDTFHPEHNQMINISGPQKDPITNKHEIKYITTNKPIN